jgi:hypothetical protein
MSLIDPEGYAQNDKPLAFYYNRAERLASAPQIVQDYYAGKGTQPPKGLFKALVATKFSRMLLVTIVAMCAVIAVVSQVALDGSSVTVAGIPAGLSAFSFDNTIYVSIELKKTVSAAAMPVLARIALTGKGGNDTPQIYDIQVIQGIYRGNQEFLRTTFPDYGEYGIIGVEVLLEVQDKTGTLKAKIAQK